MKLSVQAFAHSACTQLYLRCTECVCIWMCVPEKCWTGRDNWSGNSDPSNVAGLHLPASRETRSDLCSLWKHHRNNPCQFQFHFQSIASLCCEFNNISNGIPGTGTKHLHALTLFCLCLNLYVKIKVFFSFCVFIFSPSGTMAVL